MAYGQFLSPVRFSRVCGGLGRLLAPLAPRISLHFFPVDEDFLLLITRVRRACCPSPPAANPTMNPLRPLSIRKEHPPLKARPGLYLPALITFLLISRLISPFGFWIPRLAAKGSIFLLSSARPSRRCSRGRGPRGSLVLSDRFETYLPPMI